MRTITYQAAEREDQTVSAFLMMVMEYGQEIGMFGLLGEKVKVAMREVRYSLVQKAQTVIASLVMGCGHTKAINEVLKPETTVARYLGLDQFPDQSQINRYLTRFSAENVEELGEVHAEMFMRESRARRAVGMVVVDIDQCGLVANGKTYEFKRKGYFPRKRGEEGYQVSAAFLVAYDEAVQIYLDPGNMYCSHRLADLLRDTDRVLGLDNPGVTIIRRLDAGYDSPANREIRLSLPGHFTLKSRQPKLACRLAQQVPVQDWIPINDTTHGTELPSLDGCRRLLYELHLTDGSVEYALHYTNLPAKTFGIQRCFTFCNQRQTIEALFASPVMSTTSKIYVLENSTLSTLSAFRLSHSQSHSLAQTCSFCPDPARRCHHSRPRPSCRPCSRFVSGHLSSLDFAF